MNRSCFHIFYSLTRLNLSASCGGRCLNRVCRHPSQLSVRDVPTAVPPQTATLLAENINSTSWLFLGFFRGGSQKIFMGRPSKFSGANDSGGDFFKENEIYTSES